MNIVETYSHLNGLEFLLVHKPGAIVNSCVWDSGGDPFFFNTINEFYSLNNLSQALRTM